MYVPIIGALSAILAAVGLYGCYWYENLSKEEREEADRLAAEYARSMYERGLNQLTRAQLKNVLGVVQQHFV